MTSWSINYLYQINLIVLVKYLYQINLIVLVK